MAEPMSSLRGLKSKDEGSTARRPSLEEQAAETLSSTLERVGLSPTDVLGARAKESFAQLVGEMADSARAGRPLTPNEVERAARILKSVHDRERFLMGSPPGQGTPQVLDARTLGFQEANGASRLSGAYPPALENLLRGLGIDPARVPPEVAQAILEAANDREGRNLHEPAQWRALGDRILDAIPDARPEEGGSPTAPKRTTSTEPMEPTGSAGSAGSAIPKSAWSREQPQRVDGAAPLRVPGGMKAFAAPVQGASNDGSTASGMTAGRMPRSHGDQALDTLTPLFVRAGITSARAQREAAARFRTLIQDVRQEAKSGSPAEAKLKMIDVVVRNAPSPAAAALRSRIEELTKFAANPGYGSDTLDLMAGGAIAGLVLPGVQLDQNAMRDLARLATELATGRPVPTRAAASTGLPPELSGPPELSAQQALLSVLPDTATRRWLEMQRVTPDQVQGCAMPALTSIFQTQPKDRTEVVDRSLDWLKGHGMSPGTLSAEEVSLSQIRDHLPEIDAQLDALSKSLKAQEERISFEAERYQKTQTQVERASETQDPAADILREKLGTLHQGLEQLGRERSVTLQGLTSAEATKAQMVRDLDGLMRRVLGKVVDFSVQPQAVLTAANSVAPQYADGLKNFVASAGTAGAGANGANGATGANGAGGVGGTSGLRPLQNGASQGLTLAQQRARACAEVLADKALNMTDKVLLFVLLFAHYASTEHEQHLKELAELDKKEADWEALHKQLSSRCDALETQRQNVAKEVDTAHENYEAALTKNGGKADKPEVLAAKSVMEQADNKLAQIDKLRIEVNRREQEVLKNKPKEARDVILAKMNRTSQIREMMMKLGNDFMDEEKRVLERINRF